LTRVRRLGWKIAFPEQTGWLWLWMLGTSFMLLFPTRCSERYLLPAFPAAGLLTALGLRDLLQWGGRVRRWGFEAPLILAAILALMITTLGIALHLKPDLLNTFELPIKPEHPGFQELLGRVHFYAMAFLLCGLIGLFGWLRKKPIMLLGGAVLLGISIQVFSLGEILPLDKAGKSAQPFAQAVQQKIRETGNDPTSLILYDFTMSEASAILFYSDTPRLQWVRADDPNKEKTFFSCVNVPGNRFALFNDHPAKRDRAKNFGMKVIYEYLFEGTFRPEARPKGYFLALDPAPEQAPK